MSGVSKSFGPVHALVDADFELAAGEVHGLVGGNGAGKTTLMNVLYGLYRPDAGEIRVDGEEVHIRSPRDAIGLGIGMVHQHLLQVSTYSVVENVVLGTSEVRAGCGKAARRIAELSDRFGLAVDPRARTDRLSVGARQRVEILKVLYRGARILILDEPTTNLTPQEVDDLFASLRVIVAEGTSVVFISHKVREVLAICDRISVMRDGRRLTTVQRSATDADGPRLADGGRARRRAVLRRRRRPRAGRRRRGGPGRRRPRPPRSPGPPPTARLTVSDLVVHNDQGVPAVRGAGPRRRLPARCSASRAWPATARWNWPRRWPASARCTPAASRWTAPTSPARTPAGGWPPVSPTCPRTGTGTASSGRRP